MKIALITPVFWPCGSHTAFPFNMVTMLRDAGHDVVVHTMDVSPDGKKITAESTWNGVPIIRYKTYGKAGGVFSRVWFPLLGGYDLIHYTGGYRHPCMLSAFGKRYIISPFFPCKPRDSKLTESICNLIDKTFGGAMLRNAKAVLAETNKEAEWLRSLGVKKIEIIPNPLPEEAFSQQDRTLFRNEHRIPGELPIIFSLGGFSYIKNQQEQLKALSYIKQDFVMVIGGEGEKEAELRELVSSLRIKQRIIWPGSFFGNMQGKMQAFASADLFIHSSLHEGLGAVCLEAAAQNKPVIAARVGGLVDVLPNDSFYTLGKPEELAAKIKTLLNDDVLAKQIGRLGREKAEQYRYSLVGKRYVSLCNSLVTANL